MQDSSHGRRKKKRMKHGEDILKCARSLNPLYFHIIGDGHQLNSRGLYTHYKDSLLKVG